MFTKDKTFYLVFLLSLALAAVIGGLAGKILGNFVSDQMEEICVAPLSSIFSKRPWLAIIVDKDLVQSTDDLVDYSFESQVVNEVKRICKDVYPDLDPDYILAMIYRESRFQPDALNPKTGATGLMQILPKWHTARAEKLGVSLYDWRGNILTGCDLLNEIVQDKGSLSYAVNFYAGGYEYADYYKRTHIRSPYERSLEEILSRGVLDSIREVT